MKKFLKNVLNFVILSLMTCVLAGCVGSMKTVTVEKTKTKFVEIDPSLLKACDVEPPPAEGTYLSSDYQKKEAAAWAAYRKQTANVAACNTQIKGAKDWSDKMKKIWLDIFKPE